MKTMSSAVNAFSDICSTLFYRHNLKCTEELCVSEFYEDYFSAAFNLSKWLVRTPYFYGRIVSLGYLHSCDHDDIAQELSIIFVKKYTTIIRAMVRTGDSHNHRSYSCSMLSSMLKDIYRSYKDPDNSIVDENGNIKPAHIIFCSLNAVLSENDSTSFIDTLSKEDISLINSMKKCEDNESASIKAILSYMKTVSKHKTKGEVLSLLMYGLKAEGSAIKITDASKAIYNNGDVNISAFYHKLLNKYNEMVLNLSEEEISRYFDYSEEDFGDFDRTSPKTIAAKLSKWNNLVKEDLKDRVYLYKNKQNKISKNL